MTVLIASAIIFFALIFPLKINCFAFVNFNKKIATFGVYVYFFKVVSGYVGVAGNEIYIRIANKVFKSSVKETVNNDSGALIFKNVSLNKVDFLFEYGSKSTFTPVYLWQAVNVFGYALNVVLAKTLDAQINGDYIFSTESDEKNFYLKGVFVTNLVLLLMIILSLLIKKVRNEKRK